MTRLIDADELKTQIPTIEDEYKYVHKLIDNAPTVEERPQGEWGPCYENYRNGMFYRDCSICGKATITGDWKFCPYCGAEMKGGAE